MPFFAPLITVLLLIGTFSTCVQAQMKLVPEEVSVAKCWSYPTGEAAGTDLTSGLDRVFVAFQGGRLDAISDDGKKLWTADFGGDVASNLVIAKDRLLVVTVTGSEQGPKTSTLRSISTESGLAQWTVKLPMAVGHFMYLVNDAVIIVSANGSVQSIDPANGTTRWQRQLAEGFAARPALGVDRIYVASTGKQIFVLKTSTGEVDAMQKVLADVSALAPDGPDSVIVGDERGNVTSLSVRTGKAAWQFRTGGLVSSLVPIDDHILATSHDNFAYFLEARKGGLAWKRRLLGRASEAAAIGDQYALTSSIEEHGATLASISTGKVAGQIALGAEEILVAKPIVNGTEIFALTNQSVYRFDLNGCSKAAETAANKR